MPLMRGTLLNTATVLGGSAVGLAIGRQLPVAYEHIALQGLGLVTFGIGMRMFLQTKNPIVVAIAIAAGGCLGLAIGLAAGLDSVAEWAHRLVGGGSDGASFTTGLVAASILFCVGPMTVLGCVQDGLEGNIELLSLKSTMDGVAAIFLAATFGFGVLFSAAIVLIFQGLLTLLARPLAPLTKIPDLISELSATGGAMMLAIGLGLLEVVKIQVVSYLPALFLAPLVAIALKRLVKNPKAVAA